MDTNRVSIEYTNWRGERRVREIIPLTLEFGVNDWHPKPQYLLRAIDVETTTEKEFAMEGIHSWTPVPSGEDD